MCSLLGSICAYAHNCFSIQTNDNHMLAAAILDEYVQRPDCCRNIGLKRNSHLGCICQMSVSPVTDSFVVLIAMGCGHAFTHLI